MMTHLLIRLQLCHEAIAVEKTGGRLPLGNGEHIFFTAAKYAKQCRHLMFYAVFSYAAITQSFWNSMVR
jgi:hypothetical protein